MSLKVAIVGCGKIAEGHAEAIKRSKGKGTLIAACDLEKVIAEQFAVRMGVPSFYDDFERMMAVERPDVVHITTPPSSHVHLATRSMDLGAHTLVEKPLAMDRVEGKKIIDHAVATNKKLTIGWEFNFEPPALAIKDLLSSGVVGDVVHVEAHFGFDTSGNFGDILLRDKNYWVYKLPGLLFHNSIDHLFNKIMPLIPDEEPAVYAHAYTRRKERFGDIRDQAMDELRVMVKGEAVTAFGSYSVTVRPAGHFLRIYGTKNTIHADYTNRTVVVEAAPKFPSAIGRLFPSFNEGLSYLREGSRNLYDFARSEFHYFTGMRNLVEAYYDSILNDSPPPVPYRDMDRVSYVMDEIFRQVREGGQKSS